MVVLLRYRLFDHDAKDKQSDKHQQQSVLDERVSAAAFCDYAHLCSCSRMGARLWRGDQLVCPILDIHGLEHTGKRGSGVDRVASWAQTLIPDVVMGMKG